MYRSDEEASINTSLRISMPHSENLEGDVPESELLEAHKSGFGEKTIGPFSSIILLFNNLSGPGVVGLPLMFQQAGWFVPTFSMIFISISTWLSSTMLCEAMRYYPGNRGYKSRIEFSTLCKFYFGKKIYMVTQLIFIFSLQAVNVTGIIETAQVMDLVVLKIFGKTGGLEFYPHFGWTWAYQGGRGSSPFSSDIYILSLGIVITVILIIPLGYFNLDDNIIIQKVAFLVACIIFGEWFILFFIRIHEGNTNIVPSFGNDIAPAFGTIMFNYAMVVTVPSWCNEKTHSTRVNRVMGGATLIGTILFFIIGWVGAIAYKIDPSGDLLSSINDIDSNIVSQIGVYIFPLAVVATSIPIYSIIIRYNLLENNICPRPLANFFAVIMPWLVVIPFYTGEGLSVVINWSTLCSSGIVNFILPFIIYIEARRYKVSLSEEEAKLLDTPVKSIEEEEVHCFGWIVIPSKEVEERPHFAFGKYVDDYSLSPYFISIFFAFSLSIASFGVIILNIMQTVNIP